MHSTTFTWRPENNLQGNWLSLLTIWVPRMKLRLAGLMANAFTHWASLLVLIFQRRTFLAASIKRISVPKTPGCGVGRTQVGMLWERCWMQPHTGQDGGCRAQVGMPQARLHIVPLSFLPFLQLWTWTLVPWWPGPNPLFDFLLHFKVFLLSLFP